MNPLTPAVMLLAVFTAGVLLLWWKLHQVGLSFAELNTIMKRPQPRNLQALDAILQGREPKVYVPVRIKYADLAPAPLPGSYRDDTGKEA